MCVAKEILRLSLNVNHHHRQSRHIQLVFYHPEVERGMERVNRYGRDEPLKKGYRFEGVLYSKLKNVIGSITGP